MKIFRKLFIFSVRFSQFWLATHVDILGLFLLIRNFMIISFKKNHAM